MSLSLISTSNEQSLYAALELSKNSWLLAIQLTAMTMDVFGVTLSIPIRD